MIKDESGSVTADIDVENRNEEKIADELDEMKRAQIEEKRPWKRSEKYRREGRLVGCDICHSLRGTFRKDPYVKEDAVYCENCWPIVMKKRYGGKVVVKK